MVRFNIKDKFNIIIFYLVGTVSSQEMIEQVQALKLRDKINPGVNIAMNTREQINVFSRDEILKIIFEIVGAEKQPMIRKMAIITVSDEEFGTGKIYSVVKNKSKVEVVVFSNIDTAVQWLDIPKDVKLF